ncbi:MAG TPA: AAA family ATPase [Syntrophomonas sp.]|nr:AAA family ATPase [Syntrophomonas sp.]
MGMIEGFRIQNFGVLKDIKLGKLWNEKGNKLTPLVAVIGRNGVGKSTLFDAFGFLSDCLKHGVEEACDLKARGGFSKIISAGSQEPIRFELYYRETTGERPITYELEIDIDSSLRPYVKSERLRQRRKGQSKGQPFSFLNLSNGKGEAWRGTSLGEEESEKVSIELIDARHLGISTYGALKEHPRITAFREFLENWYLCYFEPDAARSLPLAGPQKYLNLRGDNLGNVVQYMERDNPDQFKKILDKISSRIPGVNKISTKKTDDGRLLIQFNDKGFTDPFYAQQMSDGTLKYFAYMLLLEEPTQRPFICIEEPENGLYHKMLESLAMEFKRYAIERKTKSQIFVTTHSPYFIDALNPEEVWILEKNETGFSTIRRASDDAIIKAMVEEGITLGSLWFSDYLDKR